MIEIVFYLVIGMDRGTTIVPEPMTEKACRVEAIRINKPSPDGGMGRGGYAYCVRVERIAPKA